MSSHIAYRILRYSWAVLFLWFGYQQVIASEVWIGFLPEFIGYFPIPGEMIVQLNGWFEIIASMFLITGTWLKPIVILLSLHLFVIAISAGGAIGMRDAVLAVMGLALLFMPADPWTVEVLSGRGKNKD